MVVSCTVSENGRIENFAAGAAFPCIKRTDEVVVFLSVHSASALRAFHDSLLLYDGMAPVFITNAHK